MQMDEIVKTVSSEWVRLIHNLHRYRYGNRRSIAVSYCIRQETTPMRSR